MTYLWLVKESIKKKKTKKVYDGKQQSANSKWKMAHEVIRGCFVKKNNLGPPIKCLYDLD